MKILKHEKRVNSVEFVMPSLQKKSKKLKIEIATGECE